MSEKTPSQSSFLFQIYFVIATLIGLVVVVIGAVNATNVAVKSILGVQSFPYFAAPYPPENVKYIDDTATEEQKKKLAEWEQQYNQWQADQKSFNESDQTTRRDLAVSVAFLIVGIPVFAVHAPYVFKKRS